MSLTLINTADFDEIRALIDTTLTSTQLPNSIVGMTIFSGVAESAVVRVYPTALSETDPIIISHLRLATIFYTASLLARQVPMLLKEHFGNYHYERMKMDVNALADRLWSYGEDELDQVIDPGLLTSPVPILFTTVHGNRGDL